MKEAESVGLIYILNERLTNPCVLTTTPKREAAASAFPLLQGYTQHDLIMMK